MTQFNQANVSRFSGFADEYDRYRPSPPVVVTEILPQLIGQPRPRRVVDLGSGTGLSTRLWAGRADEVIGIEPSPDMRGVAEAQSAGMAGIRYQEGHSAATGLADGGADIICCTQAFHWMEPAATLREACRVLRDGGVFCTVDCDWPPVIHWEVDRAFHAFMVGIHESEERHGIYQTVQRWQKDRHLANITASGLFRYTNEIVVHQVESADAHRLLGLLQTFGSVKDLQKHGLSDDEIGITAFRAVAQRVLGEGMLPIYFSYRLRLGVK